MEKGDFVDAIPEALAWQLCADIRQENQGRWYSWAGIQCWFCVKFSKGDRAKMCVSNQPGYRGCNLVNARYVRQLQSAG